MLHTLKPAKGSRKKIKRIARGDTTAGRGTKGQHARTGKGQRFGFEGGQTPLIRRQPKLGGFVQPGRREYGVLNVDDLAKMLGAGSYDIAALRQRKMVRTKKPVKILGRGALTKKLSLSVHAVSGSAKEAIEKAGGTITIVK